MTTIAYLVVILAAIQVGDSYILLTANLEDLHNLSEQVKNSPVLTQVKKIWRRAQSTFNEHLKKYGEDDPDIDSPREENSAGKQLEPRVEHRRRSDGMAGDQEMVALGNQASKYLKSINKLFE